MRRHRITKLFLIFLLNTAAVLAQASKVQYVTLAPVSKIEMKHGRSAPLELAFTIAPNVHVNSNIPSSDTLIPTVLKLELPEGLTSGKLAYPKGQSFAFPFSPNEKLSVYTETFTIKTILRSLPKARPGSYTVHGILGYQACNDRACFPPKKLPVQFDVTLR